MDETKNTISIRECFQIIKQHYLMTASIILFSIMVSCSYYFLSPKVYNSIAVIQIGQVWQLGQLGRIEEAATAATQLKMKWMGGPLPRLESIDAAHPNNIILKASASSATEAQQLLYKIGNLLIAEHQDYFKKRMDIAEYGIKSQKDLLVQLETVEKEHNDLGPSNSERILGRMKVLEMKLGVQSQILSYELAVSGHTIFPTRWLNEPNLPNRPSSPNLTRASLLALLSLVGSTMVVIIKQRWFSKSA